MKALTASSTRATVAAAAARRTTLVALPPSHGASSSRALRTTVAASGASARASRAASVAVRASWRPEGGGGGPPYKDEDDLATQAKQALADIKERWDAVEDKQTLLVAVGGSVAAAWLASNVLSVLDRIPLVPQLLEFVGLTYGGWFFFRYVLFKANRDELRREIDLIRARFTQQAADTAETIAETAEKVNAAAEAKVTAPGTSRNGGSTGTDTVPLFRPVDAQEVEDAAAAAAALRCAAADTAKRTAAAAGGAGGGARGEPEGVYWEGSDWEAKDQERPPGGAGDDDDVLRSQGSTRGAPPGVFAMLVSAAAMDDGAGAAMDKMEDAAEGRRSGGGHVRQPPGGVGNVDSGEDVVEGVGSLKEINAAVGAMGGDTTSSFDETPPALGGQARAPASDQRLRELQREAEQAARGQAEVHRHINEGLRGAPAAAEPRRGGAGGGGKAGADDDDEEEEDPRIRHSEYGHGP